MPGPCNSAKGGKSKAVLVSRPPFRGEYDHKLNNQVPSGLRKKLQKLARRQTAFTESLTGKDGYRKPGSMNLRKG